MEPCVNRRAEHGFTLLEVMVAMGILAVGLTAVVTLFSRSTAAIAEAEAFERAGIEGRMRLAEFLNDQPLPPEKRNGACADLPGGIWSVEARKMPDNPDVGVVTVKVRFNAGGRPRILVLETAQADMSLPLSPERE